jgi:hypothetical protein
LSFVDGIRQTEGTQSGTFVWAVNNLAPGAYYVSGVICDAKGVGRAYAAGAMLVPNPTLSGLPPANKLSDGVLVFGAVATGETVRSVDTITLRRSTQLANPTTYLRTNGRWGVVVTPAP